MLKSILLLPLLLPFFAGLALAQSQYLVPGASAGGTSCSGSASIGYVATATSGGASPTCSWQSAGAASVTESAINSAEAVTVAGTNTLTGGTVTTYGSLTTGFGIRVLIANTNTTAVTLNINSIGPSAVTKNGTSALTGGELIANHIYFLVWDGTQWQILATYTNGTNGQGLTSNGVGGFGTPVTLPAGAVVGTTDTQSLTNKTVDGVSPTTMAFLDATSSVQTQLNAKQASLGFTAENAANKDAASGYAGLTAGSLLKAAEFPALTGDITTSAGSLATVLATVNSNIGTCGDSTHVGQVTLNGKGLTTACTPIAIAGSSSAFAGLTSGTNTTAIMHVGTGASLDATGSGTLAATTAAALASAPTKCSAGSYTLGIDVNGNAQNCTALPTFPAGTIVGTSDTQTLTSKTLTSPSLGAGSSPVTETWTVGTGGVAVNTLVQADTSAPLKIVASTTGSYGVAMGTVSAAGSVEVARSGTVSCITDTGGATAGDLVVLGTGSPINCKDSLQTSSSAIPISTRIIGVFRSTAIAGATALVELTPAHFGTSVTQVVLGNPSIKVGSYQLVAGDSVSGVVFNGSGTYTLTLPATQPVAPWGAPISNCSTHDLTLTVPGGYTVTDPTTGSTTTTPAALQASTKVGICTGIVITVDPGLATNYILRAAAIVGPTGPTGTVSVTAGTSVSLTSATAQMFVCTGTCTVTVPVPAQGAQYCVYNDDNISSVITMSALSSSALYEKTDRTGYGSISGTMVSGGAVGDKVCLVFRDTTHYTTIAFHGIWTVN